MKYPRYVSRRKDSLHYQRDYPTRLRHLAPTKQFNYPLGLKAQEANERQINNAWLAANEAYALSLKMIENSDPDAFDQNDLHKAVTLFLNKRGLKYGLYEQYQVDPDIARKEQLEGRVLQPDKFDVALDAIPEFDDVHHKYNMGDKLTFEEKVIGEAYLALLDKAKEKPKTLDVLWEQYAKHKGINLDSREGKRVHRYWQQWLSHVGNHVIAPNTLDVIHHGLDDYVEQRLQDGVKGATIKRELSSIIACLRYNSRKSRFGWVIESPEIDTSDSVARHPLNRQEQRDLVDFCLAAKGTDVPVACLIIVMLQGGGMPSEVGRLKPEDLSLDAGYPFILIRNETKTNARKRLVPIVLGLDFIKQHIEETIQWIARTTETTPSARVKRLIRKSTGNDTITGHCLRHTFRINAESNQASSMAVAAIGGWSGSTVGVSNQMLNYGSEGISHSDTVKGLFRESKKIHKHLLKGDNKVVQTA